MASALDRVRAVLARDGMGWADVFAPSDFAVAHSRYLAAEIYVTGVPDHLRASFFNSWSGYVESRLRKLIEYLSYLPVCRLRLLPKKLPLLTVTDAQDGEGLAYLIGFDVDKGRMQGGELHLTNKVETFKEEVYAGGARSGILTEEVTHRQLRLKIVDFASYRELPDACFESLGGREAAKAVHKRLKATRKAAMAAAGITPTPASVQSSTATTASDVTDGGAGAKRGAPANGADDGTARDPRGEAKAARTGNGGANANGGASVPLQREMSMGNGELIDGGP